MDPNVSSNAKEERKASFVFNNWHEILSTTHYSGVVRGNTKFTLDLSRDQRVQILQNNCHKPLGTSCKSLRIQWLIHWLRAVSLWCHACNGVNFWRNPTSCHTRPQYLFVYVYALAWEREHNLFCLVIYPIAGRSRRMHKLIGSLLLDILVDKGLLATRDYTHLRILKLEHFVQHLSFLSLVLLWF